MAEPTRKRFAKRKPTSTQRTARPPIQSQQTDGGPLVRQAEISYSGPLPPPGVLKGFEQVLPGAAERIFVMAEKQLDHRIDIEKAAVESGIRNSAAGIKAAVVIEAMLVAGSCYLAHLGLGAEALKVMGGSVVMLAGAFGVGTWSRRTERIRKQKRLDTQAAEADAAEQSEP